MAVSIDDRLNQMQAAIERIRTAYQDGSGSPSLVDEEIMAHKEEVGELIACLQKRGWQVGYDE